MRRFDGSAKCFAADVGVRLEPRDTFIRPVVDDAARLLRRADLRHRRGAARAREIRASEMHAGTGDLAALDPLFHVDLVIRRRATGGADRRQTRAEVEARRGELQLHAAATRRVERVIVEARRFRESPCVRPDRSCARRPAPSLVQPALTLVIRPFSMTRVCPSRGAAPVPSITRTLVSATDVSGTVTYSRTSLDSVVMDCAESRTVQ